MKIEVLSASSLIIALATFAISYLVYKRNSPILNTQIHIIPDDDSEMNKKLGLSNSTNGFFIYLQIANSGFRTITAMYIANKKGEIIMPIVIKKQFGCTLKEGDTITHKSDVSPNGVKLLRKAKKLYVIDTANRKHFVKIYNGKKHLTNHST